MQRLESATAATHGESNGYVGATVACKCNGCWGMNVTAATHGKSNGYAGATAACKCNGLQRMGKVTARPRRFCPVDGESGNNPRGYGLLRETARAWRGQLGPPTGVSETLIARIDKNRAVVFRYCPSRRREQTEEAACRYRAMLGRYVLLVRDHRPLQAGQRQTRTRMHVACDRRPP
jgi:hypothetical protein